MRIQRLMIKLTVIGLVVIFGAGMAAAKISIDVNCTMKPGGAEEASIKKFKEMVEKDSGGRK